MYQAMYVKLFFMFDGKCDKLRFGGGRCKESDSERFFSHLGSIFPTDNFQIKFDTVIILIVGIDREDKRKASSNII